MTQIATALIAASVSLVVAVLTPSVTSLRTRRQALNDRFDHAVAVLLRVQAARHIALAVPRSYHKGTDEEYRVFLVSIQEQGIKNFLDMTTEAKAALASPSPHVPEVRDWITSGWEFDGGARTRSAACH